MNGIHDMGGIDGFGPIVVQRAEPVFHSRWEGRVHAMCENMAGRLFQADQHRYAIEQMPVLHYLETGYYERWLEAAEKVLIDNGLITREELLSGHAAVPPATPPGRESRPSEVVPNLKPGDRVRTLNISPKGHTRLPRYARGKHGIVKTVNGPFLLPDVNAHRSDASWEPCYAVEFTAVELWGPQCNPRDLVCVDVWQSHLTKDDS